MGRALVRDPLIGWAKTRTGGVACSLLQRAACHEAYGVPHTAALIQRTKGGKPYLAARPDTARAGTPDPGHGRRVHPAFEACSRSAVCIHAFHGRRDWGFDVAAPADSLVIFKTCRQNLAKSNE